MVESCGECCLSLFSVFALRGGLASSPGRSLEAFERAILSSDLAFP